MVDIQERKAQRARVMNALFDAADGRSGSFVDMTDLAPPLGLTEGEVGDAADYLEGEGLIVTARPLGALAPNAQLTHWGIKEIEQQRFHPAQPTAHFPAFNVINIHGDVNNAPFQQGSPGATQEVHYNQDQRKQVLDFVVEARSRVQALGLSPEDAAELEAHLATAEAQARAPRGVDSLIRGALDAAKAVLLAAATTEASTLLLNALSRIPH